MRYVELTGIANDAMIVQHLMEDRQMPFDGFSSFRLSPFRRFVGLFQPKLIDNVLNPRQITLPGLIHLLRHRELWPADFHWNYVSSHNCAMGLASCYWKHDRLLSAPMLADAIGLPLTNVEDICLYHRRNHQHLRMRDITPEHIADAFEQCHVTKR